MSFQIAVNRWMHECFGREIAADRMERNHRFLEEALELVQACGCTQSEAYQLVEYVFGRPTGEVIQECGGVMVTLAALCNTHAIEMQACGDRELARVWQNIDKIRTKQAAKPAHGPLPQTVELSEWDLIQGLRETEGSTVTIVADNGDFSGPNSMIVCSDDWTGWKDEQFTGDTVLEALRNAYAEMKRRAS